MAKKATFEKSENDFNILGNLQLNNKHPEQALLRETHFANSLINTSPAFIIVLNAKVKIYHGIVELEYKMNL